MGDGESSFLQETPTPSIGDGDKVGTTASMATVPSLVGIQGGMGVAFFARADKLAVLSSFRDNDSSDMPLKALAVIGGSSSGPVSNELRGGNDASRRPAPRREIPRIHSCDTTAFRMFMLVDMSFGDGLSAEEEPVPTSWTRTSTNGVNETDAEGHDVVTLSFPRLERRFRSQTVTRPGAFFLREEGTGVSAVVRLGVAVVAASSTASSTAQNGVRAVAVAWVAEAATATGRRASQALHRRRRAMFFNVQNGQVQQSSAALDLSPSADGRGRFCPRRGVDMRARTQRECVAQQM